MKLRLLLYALVTLLSAEMAYSQTARVDGDIVDSSGATISLNLGTVLTDSVITCGITVDSAGATVTDFSMTAGSATIGTILAASWNPTSGGNRNGYGYYLVVESGGTLTLTATPSLTATTRIICDEISGANTSPSLDVAEAMGNSDPGQSTDGMTSGGGVSPAAGSYLFGFAWYGGGSLLSNDIGTGFSAGENASDYATSEYIEAFAGGSQAATFTCISGATCDSGGNGIGVGLISIKVAAVGGPSAAAIFHNRSQQ